MGKVLFEYKLRETLTDLWIGKGGCELNTKYDDYFVVDTIPDKNDDLKRDFFHKVIFNTDLESFFRAQFQERTTKEAKELKSTMELYLDTGGIDLFFIHDDCSIEENYLPEFFNPTHPQFQFTTIWKEAKKKLQVNYDWVLKHRRIRRIEKLDRLIFKKNANDINLNKRNDRLSHLKTLRSFGKSLVEQYSKPFFDQFITGKIPDNVIVWSGTKREMAQLLFLLKKSGYVENENQNLYYLVSKYIVLDMTTKHAKRYKSKRHFTEDYLKNEFKTFYDFIIKNKRLNLIYEKLCSDGILEKSR